MKTWTKILPFFFIEWYSKRYCERICICTNGTYAIAFGRPGNNVLVEVDHGK